jgi:predicted O-methyltransferase YrrM
MLGKVFREIRRSIGSPRYRKTTQRPGRSYADGAFTDLQHRLGVRAATFRHILQYLETLSAPYYIVETGTTRAPGHWQEEGNSTLIWDRFVQFWGGRVYSIDINPDFVATARQQVSERTRVVCSDSIAFLARLSDIDQAHLLYLDSYDLDQANPHPSALHHLMELTAVFARLAPGTLVAVDDCAGEHVGKHVYVSRYFESIGIAPLFRGYQTGWVIPAR